jgi:hypothetical protein
VLFILFPIVIFLLLLLSLDNRLREQIGVCNQLVGILQTTAAAEFAGQAVAESVRRLLSLRKVAAGQNAWQRPDTPRSVGCLDPSLVSQLQEITSYRMVDISGITI